VTWLSGACVAAPRARLLELGPFDETLHLYSEDLELGLRAARSGVASWFLPDVARIVHVGDVSSARRYADSGLEAAAANGRLVLERAFGKRVAARAQRADRLRLRLRLSAKRLLRRPTERDRAALAALRRASAGAGG
jgi:GT2 family glycosyltransferase